MSEPAAVTRAQSLVDHAQYCAAPLHQFAVTITKDEGFELLDWFLANAIPEQINVGLLAYEITRARQLDDPWHVLPDFSLFGLPIIRQELH